MIYFSLREYMMCGVRVVWLVGYSNNNEGGRVFAKGQLYELADKECDLAN